MELSLCVGHTQAEFIVWGHVPLLQASRRAVMLPEVVEVDGLPALKLHMYKQDTLTGGRAALCPATLQPCCATWRVPPMKVLCQEALTV